MILALIGYSEMITLLDLSIEVVKTVYFESALLSYDGTTPFALKMFCALPTLWEESDLLFLV